MAIRPFKWDAVGRSVATTPASVDLRRSVFRRRPFQVSAL